MYYFQINFKISIIILKLFKFSRNLYSAPSIDNYDLLNSKKIYCSKLYTLRDGADIELKKMKIFYFFHSSLHMTKENVI